MTELINPETNYHEYPYLYKPYYGCLSKEA